MTNVARKIASRLTTKVSRHGVVSLRELVVNDQAALVAEFATTDVITVRAATPRDEVARLVAATTSWPYLSSMRTGGCSV